MKLLTAILACGLMLGIAGTAEAQYRPYGYNYSHNPYNYKPYYSYNYGYSYNISPWYGYNNWNYGWYNYNNYNNYNWYNYRTPYLYQNQAWKYGYWPHR